MEIRRTHAIPLLAIPGSVHSVCQSCTALSNESNSRPASPDLELEEQKNVVPHWSNHHSKLTTPLTWSPRSLSPQAGDKRRHDTPLFSDGDDNENATKVFDESHEDRKSVV